MLDYIFAIITCDPNARTKNWYKNDFVSIKDN